MLIYFSTLFIAIALAIVTPLTFWKIHAWYDFYIPIVMFIAGIVGMILLWWILLWLFGKFVKKEMHSKQSKWARFWLEQGHDFLMLASFTRIVINNKEKIPTNGKFLLVGNHRSNFDSMAMTSKLKKYRLAFITKNSNYKIPLFGRLLYGACFYPVERDNQLQSLEAFKHASELIMNNECSIGVFPEGRRQRDLVLDNFHEGVFNIALRAKCPLVIVTEDGSEMVQHNFPLPSKITIDVLGTIPYEELEGQTAKAISDKVHKIMEEHLEKINIMKYQRKLQKKHKRKEEAK